MNIDERLAALTQTVELIASMQLTTAKRMADLVQESRRFERNVNRFRHFAMAIGADHKG